jgi:hypothetical protein
MSPEELFAWAADAAHLLRELHPVVFGCATLRERELDALLRRYDGLPRHLPMREEAVAEAEPVKRCRRAYRPLVRPEYPVLLTDSAIAALRLEAKAAPEGAATC